LHYAVEGDNHRHLLGHSKPLPHAGDLSCWLCWAATGLQRDPADRTLRLASLHGHSASCPLRLSSTNGPTVISSAQTTPKPLLPFSFPAHTGHSLWPWRNRKFWCTSHTLTKFWPPLLRVMSVRVSHRGLCVPSRLSQPADLAEALE